MKSKLNKKDAADEADITVIAESTRIDDAVMNTKGIVKIEGEYHGNISIDGELIVGESGYISGHVNANSADIYGNIIGNVICSDWLHIKATGTIKGDITCDAILMDEGAVFIGYSNMKERGVSVETNVETEIENELNLLFEPLEASSDT